MNYENELNQKQFEAVSSEDQYLRIIAGAGSGKTRVLTYRIAYLIEKLDVRPYQILAITFTNKVAKEMKERTISLLPDHDLSGLTISTFHSFCAKFLRCEIDCLDFPRNYTIYDDEDSMRLIKMIGQDFGYKKTDDNNKKAMNFISYYKTLGKLPSDVKLDKKKEEDKLYLKYFNEYELRKSEAKALDFDDLLIYTIKILEAFPEVRMKYANRIKHILVDEFQDTNDLQFKLLTLLSNGYNSLYVVGDPDQTIYTWRGANQKIILDIDKIYHPMKTIILNENYRSTSVILNASNKLISHNKERVKKDLFTNKIGGEAITFKNLDSSLQEARFIANTIQNEIIKSGAQYKDIAVLYRSSYLSLKVETELTSRQIPYRVYGGLKFYSRKEIKDCLAYFHLFVNPDDEVSFERIINVPKRGIGDKGLDLLKEEAKENGLSTFRYVLSLKTVGSKLRPQLLTSLYKLIDNYQTAKNKLNENLEAYSEVLNNFLKDIGYFDYLSDNEDDDDKLENVKALIDDIRSYLKNHEDSTFEEYLQNVALLTSQDEINNDNSVSLMTVHTAKGLEFDYVFVIGLNQGVFPNNRAIVERTENGLEEERRLAYVAMTRARKKLYLTLNRDYSYSLSTNNLPSQFLKEAGIDIPSFSFKDTFNSSTNNVTSRVYKYDLDANKGTGSINSFTRSNPFSTSNPNLGNGIKWEVGDLCHHDVFGDGKIISVNGDIVEIVFNDFGKKTLIGTIKKLHKKENA